MKMVLAVLLVLLLFCFVCNDASAVKKVERTKEFSEYKCKMTLPSSRSSWINTKRYPGAIAALRDENGAKLVLKILDDGQKFPKDLPDAMEFEKDLVKSRKVKIFTGICVSFRKVDCFDFHGFFEADESMWSARIFQANGHIYHLEVLDCPVRGIDRADRIKPIFESFEFIGEPVLPAKEKSPYALSRQLGVIVRYALIGAVVLGIIKVIRRKG